MATYIFAQVLIFVPLSLTRNIAKLSGTALIADVFILLGLVYVYYYSIYHIAVNGIASDTMLMFNKADWSLFIGTAIFTFEGIGLLIPIQESMKHPNHFQPSLSAVMCIVAVVFISCGLLCYAAFGADVKTVVLLNFPQDSSYTLTVQLLYALAILLSTPLQLFPAIRILENWTFPSNASGKHNPKVKWLKNYFRCAIVLLTSVLGMGRCQRSGQICIPCRLLCMHTIDLHISTDVTLQGVQPIWNFKGKASVGFGCPELRSRCHGLHFMADYKTVERIIKHFRSHTTIHRYLFIIFTCIWNIHSFIIHSSHMYYYYFMVR